MHVKPNPTPVANANITVKRIVAKTANCATLCPFAYSDARNLSGITANPVPLA